MSEFVDQLREVLVAHSNKERAITHKAYLKDHFEAFGIKTPVRREVVKPFLAKEYLPVKSEAFDIVAECWEQPERDFQMFGLDLIRKYDKKLEVQDMDFLEYLITHKSWWDTVDMLSVHEVGTYFKLYPEYRKKYVEKWCDQQNMWLRRTAIIFQLRYKKDTDLNLLQYAIEKNLGSKEFFINKAIGWALRDYSRVSADWVLNFIEQHPTLNSLSRREALRLIK